MKVVLGSLNGPKRMAVEASFSKVFPNEEIHVECVATDSGVRSHPVDADETMAGAMNRANDAARQVPGADYYVGIEGGLIHAGDRTWEVGLVVILDSRGVVSTGLSSGIEVKGAILQAIQEGAELSQVVENMFEVKSVGKASGFFGLATDDIVTRQSAYEQGVTFALAPFIHPEFYKP